MKFKTNVIAWAKQCGAVRTRYNFHRFHETNSCYITQMQWVALCFVCCAVSLLDHLWKPNRCCYQLSTGGERGREKWLECRLSSCYGQRKKNKNATSIKNCQKTKRKRSRKKKNMLERNMKIILRIGLIVRYWQDSYYKLRRILHWIISFWYWYFSRTALARFVSM